MLSVLKKPSQRVVTFLRESITLKVIFRLNLLSLKNYHYEKVINLNSQETLVRYAKRGKLCLEDAEKVSSLIVSSFPKLKNKPQIFDIGTTIGSHTGPGTVAVFFWGKERVL